MPSVASPTGCTKRPQFISDAARFILQVMKDMPIVAIENVTSSVCHILQTYTGPFLISLYILWINKNPYKGKIRRFWSEWNLLLHWEGFDVIIRCFWFCSVVKGLVDIWWVNLILYKSWGFHGGDY
jgi:hypothetical protein